MVVDGERRLPTLFLVDYDAAGVRLSHDPDYMHTFADRHPQFHADEHGACDRVAELRAADVVG